MSHPMQSHAAAHVPQTGHHTLDNGTLATPTEVNEGLEVNEQQEAQQQETQQHNVQQQQSEAADSDQAPAEPFFCIACDGVTDHDDLCVLEGRLTKYLRAQDAAQR
ncbi:hypothetical protein CERZMDRAFT_114995 [Cercospora zeae-maydis SCOH1-5]|uniref:Uncharacterized protein n=1 Tax=Cercospora zeae-maydis SCOH1-5 TaxID=717836 RepID=A0A6A6F5L2_9PEZI|nr:hypothetical protein CERZMDRAFT_114995 [Cercospora zeae-maydis SCOH1-5]